MLFVSCETVPEEIPEGLSRAEFFQRAQESVDAEHWETALLYYQTFLERYPDARSARAEAFYEVAFITYKQGDPEGATVLFNELIAQYEEDATGLPEWPLVLSKVLLEKIEEEKNASEEQIE